MVTQCTSTISTITTHFVPMGAAGDVARAAELRDDAARVQAVKPPPFAPKDVDEKQARATTAGAAREQAATRRSDKLGAQSVEDGSNRLFASVSSWERKLAQRANMQLGEAAKTPPSSQWNRTVLSTRYR